MTDEKIIEVEITTDDLNKMRVEGIPEEDLPAILKHGTIEMQEDNQNKLNRKSYVDFKKA